MRVQASGRVHVNLGSPSEWPAGRVAKRRCGAGGQVKPVVGGAVQFVQTTPPGLLAEYALGGLAAWFLVHPRPRPPLPPCHQSAALRAGYHIHYRRARWSFQL